jgi:hypothetical protein
MKEVVRATNAQLTINDIAITSASNVVTDAAQGVTMTLKKTGTTSMTLTQDLDSIKAAVQGWPGLQQPPVGRQAADGLRREEWYQGGSDW